MNYKKYLTLIVMAIVSATLFAETMATATPLNITSTYKIVHADNATAKSNATELKKAITAATDITLSLVTDATAATEYEIILGATNARAEHAQIKAGVPKYGYRIAIVGKKLVITASDADHMVCALRCFEDKILKDASLASSGALHFSRANEQYAEFEQTQATLASIITNNYDYTLKLGIKLFEQTEHTKADGDTYVSQGSCNDGTYLYTVHRTNPDSKSRIYKHKISDGSQVKFSGQFDGNHSNGLTFDFKHNRLVLVHGSGATKRLSFIDPKTLLVTDYIEIGRSIGAIAYNKERDMYVGSVSGSRIFFMSSTFDYNATYDYERNRETEASANHVPQDAGCDKDYVYFPMNREPVGSTKYECILVAYDWNGTYKKTFTISGATEEIESISEYNGTYYANFHIKTKGTHMYTLNIALKYTSGVTSPTKPSFSTLTIDPVGGINTMPAEHLTYDVGNSFLVTPPTRAGYTFAGWTGTGTKYLGRGVEGIADSELTFDGTNYKNLGRTYMYTDKITVNLWAHMEDWSQYITGTNAETGKLISMRLISCLQEGGWGIEANTTTGVILFSMRDGTTYKRVASTRKWSDLASGWHMFTMTFDGRNMYAYIDGQIEASTAIFTTGAIAYNGTNALFVGAEAGTAADKPVGNYFKGKIRDISILNTYTASDDIARMYTDLAVTNADNANSARYYVPEENAILTATWTENTATTLTLDAAGGQNTMAKDEYSQAIGTALTITNPVHAGYTFINWDKATSQYISNYQGIPCSSPEEVIFDGETSKKYFDLGTTYKYTDVLTMNIWAYMDNWADYAANTMRIISCTESGGWNIEPNGENIRFAIRDAAKTDGYRSVVAYKKWSDLAAGWHMFTLVFDGTRAYGYVDGEKVGQSSTYVGKIGYHPDNSIIVGAEAGTGNTAVNKYFKGKIKNLAIMHTAIDADEVATLYKEAGAARQYFPAAAHTLKAVWSENPLSTLTIDAASGVNRMEESYTRAANTALTVIRPTREGYQFTGWDKATSQYMINYQGLPCSSPEEITFDGATCYDLKRDYMYEDAFTVNVWAHMDTWANKRIFSCTHSGGFNISANPIAFVGWDKGIGYKNAQTSITWASLASGWHMFTYVFDGMNVRGYIDGELVAVGDNFQSGKLGYNETNHLFIGAEPSAKAGELESDAKYFKGKMKNFGIVPTAISAAEVKLLYDNPGITRYYFPDVDNTVTATWKQGTELPEVSTDMTMNNTDKFACYTENEMLYITGIEAVLVEVYSMTGKCLRTIHHQNKLSIAGLKGTCVVRVQDKAGHIYVDKIITK